MDRDKTKKRMKEEAATLGQWKGFTKSVIHNNRKVNIALPSFLEENDSPVDPMWSLPQEVQEHPGTFRSFEMCSSWNAMWAVGVGEGQFCFSEVENVVKSLVRDV